MRKFLIVPLLSIAAASAGAPAFAADEQFQIDAPRDQWLTIAQVVEKLTSQGYEVREVEMDDGVYEVEATTSDGRRIDAYVHPVTAEVLKEEEDD
jgi:hypothetical protein